MTMKKLAILILFVLLPALVEAQSYPSPTFNNVTMNGTATIPHAAITGGTISGTAITGGTITGLSSPIPIASGGTNATTATGAASQLQYQATGTGSVARTYQTKLGDVANVQDFGAVCTVGTNDSTSFSNALSANSAVQLPSNATCYVQNVVVGANQTLDCRGALLQPFSAGANWIVKKTGFRSVIRNCGFNDPSGFTAQSTTLSASASPGATTISVVSATGMSVGEPISIVLASGASWLTKITAISGTTITLQDAIPYSATAIASIGAAGSGYAANDALVVQGGIGAPVTLQAAVSGGGLTGSTTIAAPGLYSTAPTNPAAVYDGGNTSATGATVNITYAGANSGATVQATLGTVVVDQATQGELSNLTWSSVPAALGIYNTGSSSPTWTQGERISGVFVNAAKLFGIFRDVGVSNITVSNGVIYGATNGASAYGVAGIYLNAENVGSAPPGGNHFANLNTLNWETGWQNNAGQIDFFDAGVIADTVRNYGFVCNACTTNTFSGTTFAQFTGPNAITGSSGYGIGMYFGNSAVNNNIVGLVTNNNAADVHIADSGSAIWIGHAWSSSKKASGVTSAVQSSIPLMQATSPASVGGSGASIYLGANGYATTEAAVAAPNPLKGAVTKSYCASTGAPGAGQSYTCNLRVNSITQQSCSYSGASAFTCSMTGPSVAIFDGSTVDMQIVSSAGAAASQFRAYAAGQ